MFDREYRVAGSALSWAADPPCPAASPGGASDERATVPTYAYACADCGHAFDVVQSFSDDSLTVCPECEGRLRKQFSAVGVVFKGSGFYRTDSRSGSSGSSGKTSSSSLPSTPSSSEKAGSSTGSGTSSDTAASSTGSGSKVSASSTGS